MIDLYFFYQAIRCLERKKIVSRFYKLYTPIKINLHLNGELNL